ncbi:MAG: hypothetical protein M3R05_05820 [Chloroflexota bacterium]|nr:hypothetical protein [Chloroflexota bacterium]
MAADTHERLFRGLLVLLIAAGGFFGLAPFLLPTQFAELGGFAGRDIFMYRIAGAATFGYAVGLAAGFRSDWAALRIPIAATAVFNAASIVACLVEIMGGRAQPVVYLILLASILFTAATGYFLARPPVTPDVPDASGSGSSAMASWVVALFAIGTVAATVFGLAALIPAGAFGSAVGYSGMDDFVYRQGGAATLGAAVGGALVLISRRWESARIPARMAITFNALSAVAAALDIASGGPPIGGLILLAATLVTIGMSVAVARGGQ